MKLDAEIKSGDIALGRRDSKRGPLNASSVIGNADGNVLIQEAGRTGCSSSQSGAKIKGRRAIGRKYKTPGISHRCNSQFISCNAIRGQGFRCAGDCLDVTQVRCGRTGQTRCWWINSRIDPGPQCETGSRTCYIVVIPDNEFAMSQCVDRKNCSDIECCACHIWLCLLPRMEKL